MHFHLLCLYSLLLLALLCRRTAIAVGISVLTHASTALPCFSAFTSTPSVVISHFISHCCTTTATSVYRWWRVVYEIDFLSDSHAGAPAPPLFLLLLTLTCFFRHAISIYSLDFVHRLARARIGSRPVLRRIFPAIRIAGRRRRIPRRHLQWFAAKKFCLEIRIFSAATSRPLGNFPKTSFLERAFSAVYNRVITPFPH